MSVQKRLLALLAFLTLLSQNLFSQIVLQGAVSDNYNMPVQNALVELIDQTNANRKFSGYTNQQGQYSINIDKTGAGGVPSSSPKEFRLLQNYPNPFNPSTVIGYELPYPVHICIEIHNILGQKIKTLYDGFQPSPSGQIIWDATNDLGQSVSAGIYIYSLSAEGIRINRKMLLLDGGQGALEMTRSKPAPAGGTGQFALGKELSNVYILRITGNGIDDYEQQDLLITANTVLNIKTFRKITDIKRDSVLTSMSARFSSLINSLPKAEAAMQMASYLKTRPEFEDAGAEDNGNAWGRFTDGRLVIYVNNMDMTDTLGAVLDKSFAIPKEILADDSNPSNIPESNSVFICQALNPEGQYVWDYTHATGYKPESATQVDELMKKVKNAGIFYITTHGGHGENREGKKINDLFCMWTGTESDPNLDKEYKDDLDKNRLVYMDAVSEVHNGIEVSQRRYAFTKLFIDWYMSFSKNSLVYASACESANDTGMVNAFFRKNASVYAGFTGDLNHPYGQAATALFFSRTLGYNNVNIISDNKKYHWKETPPQRPFDWKSVLAWMQSKNYDYGDPNGVSRLVFKTNPAYGNPCGPLAPSIATIFVHPYEKELYLYGIFGDDPGSKGRVEIGGVTQPFSKWGYDDQAQMDRIICKIPTDGNGSYGDVQVIVREIKSNKTQLSRYKGDFTLIHDTDDGRKYEVKLTLQFRIHLLGFRTEPGEEPRFNQKTNVVFADMGSTGESTASGSTLADDGAVTWSGHFTGLHNNIDGAASPTSFIAGAWFDPEEKKMQIYLSGAVENGIVQTIGPASTQMLIIFGLDEFDGKHENFPSYAEITLNSDFSIPKSPKGGVTAKKVGFFYSMLAPMTDKVRIEWENIKCEAPPLDETPR